MWETQLRFFTFSIRPSCWLQEVLDKQQQIEPKELTEFMLPAHGQDYSTWMNKLLNEKKQDEKGRAGWLPGWSLEWPAGSWAAGLLHMHFWHAFPRMCSNKANQSISSKKCMFLIHFWRVWGLHWTQNMQKTCIFSRKMLIFTFQEHACC